MFCKDCNFFEIETNHCSLEPDNYGIMFPESDACNFFKKNNYEIKTNTF